MALEKIDKYSVIRELGRGATGTVYLCEDQEKNRNVAVKLVRFDKDTQAVSKRLRKLIMVEKAMGPRLRHENIVQTYDAFVSEKLAYLVMELIEGKSLEDYCSIDRLLPMDQAVGIIFKCCLALDHAYKQGIVHRDIKPANIMLDSSGNPKIADFGLAVFMHKDLNKDSTFIMGAGSPAYMSPEQIKGYQLDQKTDLYSLGVVLFQMLTGRLPFRANSAASLMYKIVNMDPPKVTDLNPFLPEALNGYIKKALEKDLSSRYESGARFATDLSSVRYQILDDRKPEEDNKNFRDLRKVDFFTEFENIELWELLRISNICQHDEGEILMEEGAEDKSFCIILDGELELSLKGKAIYRLSSGEPVGDTGYLHSNRSKRSATVVVVKPSKLMHVNASALALASDELHMRMQQALINNIIERMHSVNITLAAKGKPMKVGTKPTSNVKNELALAQD